MLNPMTTYIAANKDKQIKLFSTNNDSFEFEMRFWQSVAKLQEEKRWLCLISPPSLPDKHFLVEMGINLQRMLVVHSNHGAISSAINALKHGKCAAVITWCNELNQMEQHDLMSAAKQGHCNQVIVKKPKARQAHFKAA